MPRCFLFKLGLLRIRQMTRHDIAETVYAELVLFKTTGEAQDQVIETARLLEEESSAAQSAVHTRPRFTISGHAGTHSASATHLAELGSFSYQIHLYTSCQIESGSFLHLNKWIRFESLSSYTYSYQGDSSCIHLKNCTLQVS